ncbi:MAG: hypothetical protein O2807_02950 [bacterium]|nr:hypothetical protein [bacterium]
MGFPRGFLRALAVFLLVPLLATCARYVPIPWRDVAGEGLRVESIGRELTASLEAGLREAWMKEASERKAPLRKEPLRIVIAAFSEARTEVRTVLSGRIERAVRAALSRSPLFEIVDGGAGVAWQEAYQGRPASHPTDGFAEVDPVLPGNIQDEITLSTLAGLSPKTVRRKLALALDSGHPNEGLWHQARKGVYGAGTAIQAAEIFDAEAVVFGTYALGPERIRIWAGLVKNEPSTTSYFQKELADLFGEAEREKKTRDYWARSRASLPRRGIPPEWLMERLLPRPRLPPRNPLYWAVPAFEVLFEGIDLDGRRFPIPSNTVVGPKSQVVGRVGVGEAHYVYGFSIDETGRTDTVLSKPGQAEPVHVLPGKVKYFTARLLPAGRSFRVFFFSARESFAPAPLMEKARRRFGFVPAAPGQGRVRRSWFLPAGQEKLILDKRWDQKVFWFVRTESP